jgi:hypothetical protein
MVTVCEFVTEVDAFMNAEKRLVGIDTPQTFQEGRNNREGVFTLQLPIEINGEQSAKNNLMIKSYPNNATLKFCICLGHKWTVYRLDYDMDDVHPNPVCNMRDTFPPQINGPHYHPWQYNRERIVDVQGSIKLPIAFQLDIHIQRWDNAFRWFCDQTKIECNNHAIQLPAPTRLFP